MTTKAERLPGILPAGDVKWVGLLHTLNPEFLGLDPVAFEDVGPEVVERASPENLRTMLIDVRGNDGRAAVGYHPAEADGRLVYLALAPREFKVVSRSVRMLANDTYDTVLDSRDRKLREETGDPYAISRTDLDKREARRASVRAVVGKKDTMETHLETEVEPRIKLIGRFQEMVAHPNLRRGTERTVKQRFDLLWASVFGEMLDAMGNQQEWKEQMAERAARIVQKRIYVERDEDIRRHNFFGMLLLAEEYYAAKKVLTLERIGDVRTYLHRNAEAYEDMQQTDEERAKQKQLQISE